ncbi:MAG TPA: ATP-dependent helicase HrpB, partial [Longimicrobiales bacterium]|nr:ATP-dependent helicase HrpB [Longimicrobiales bacterium]
MSGPSPRTALPDLPVRGVLDDVRRALRGGASAILVAPPGAGKTTLTPLALLDEDWLDGRKILVLEPRRLATRAAARRMAELLGEEDVGGTVGYRIRMDTRVGRRTRVEVVTEGVLTRMLQDDPGLADVGAVLFDEFHERSLHADVGLALALQARALLRDDLRIVVMSATLDPEPVADLLDDAAVVRSEGRIFPVETRYRRTPMEGWIEPPVVAAVLRALEDDEGDVLVFLPGAGEIRRTARRLEDGDLPSDVAVRPLFGRLSRADQERAIGPSPAGRRKVVLATAIAETSLTIEGVRVVVDAGLMRVPRFDPSTGMTRLETVRVTRDSADQRRGRAGRTAPGVCYRLWTRDEDRGLVPRRTPEILEADLAPLALDLAVWGAEPGELRWLDPPPEAAFSQARELLRELEVVDRDGAVTDHGRRVAELGLHPRLAHMVVRGTDLGLGETACDLAALLGSRDILRADGRAPDADLRLRVEALARARRSGGGGRVAETAPGQRVDRGGLSRALREARHWRRIAGVGRGGESPGGGPGEGVGVLAALAYPDRIGRRREGERGRFLLRSGRGARFAEPQPLAGADWIVAAEVEGRGREARIFRAAAVEEAEVERHFGDRAEEVREVAWDPETGRVRAHRRRVLGALMLSEAPLPDPDPAEVARALAGGVRDEG